MSDLHKHQELILNTLGKLPKDARLLSNLVYRRIYSRFYNHMIIDGIKYMFNGKAWESECGKVKGGGSAEIEDNE